MLHRSLLLGDRFHCFLLTSLFFFLSLSAPFLYGQDEIPERSSDQAEVVERKIRKEVEEARGEEPRVLEIEEEKQEEPRAVPELRFKVKEIRLEGNRMIPSGEFRRLIAPFESREVTMKELNQLAETIAETYKKRGFLTTTAYVPEQRLEQDILLIRVVEGKVGQLLVDGNHFFRKKQILSYAMFQKGEVLTYQKLRKTLSKMNRNPDRHVRSILERGEKPDTTDVVLKVKDRFPVHGGFLFDNQGVRSSGRKRYGFTLRDNNLTSFDDVLYGGTILGKDFGSVFAQYLLPIPPSDTTLIFGFSHAQVLPKRNLRPFGVNGKSETYTGTVVQRVFENHYLTLDFDAGLEVRESRTKVLSGTFRRERLRIIRFGPTVKELDSWGYTDFRNECSFGIDTLGAAIHADPGNARLGVQPDFFVYRPTLARNQKMPFESRLVFKGSFQLPSHKLSSSEALYMGGASSVRGYPEGDYLADTGFLVSTELRMPSYFFPEDWTLRDSKLPLRRQIELVLFSDEGHGRLRSPSAREVESRTLFGLGGGLRVRIYDQVFARVEWAHVLGHEPLGESDHTRFHFRLQYEI